MLSLSTSHRCKTTGNRDTGASKIADHLAEGCVLAPYMLNISNAELIEGNYVIYQGDLSSDVLKKQLLDKFSISAVC